MALNPNFNIDENWRPKVTEFSAIMRSIKPWLVRMNQYNRGIDNKSVDVHLSPRFVANVKTLVNSMIQQDLATHYQEWSSKSTQAAVPMQNLERFKTEYDSLMEMSMQQRDSAFNSLTPIDWMQLAQMSIFKCLIQSVYSELLETKNNLENLLEEGRNSGKRLQYHQQVSILARENGAISYRVSRRLFGVIERLEVTRLRRLRKALLGISWPIPQEALFNVLLYLPNLLNEEIAVYHYPMLCLGPFGKQHRININNCIVEVFKNYLPDWLQQLPGQSKNIGGQVATLDDVSEPSASLRIINRLDQGNLRGFMETEIVLSQFVLEDEYKEPLHSWMDDPNNLLRLLSLSIVQEPDKPAMIPEIKTKEAAMRWFYFMRGIREELFRRLYEMDITIDIIASYWTSRVCQTLPPNTSPRLVYEYLIGRQDRQRILRRLAGTQNQDTTTNINKVLDTAIAEIKQLSKSQQRKYLGRVIVDFLNLRKDLKLAYKIFEAMDQISLFNDAKNLALSRANGLLHEFLLADEQQVERRIKSHAVLKADLRGSTKVTNELRAKKLNPATHFSQNFFAPITACLEHFGANKVFVEGDAIILSILERTGDAKSGRSVAWACGLGAEILDIVARHNITNRRYSLPELELGIGITFVDEEPTYLHDGDHPIMISPAINLADRLSSCAKILRHAPFTKTDRPFRVEVLVPPEGSDATAGAKTDVLRYNVNGIEMDDVAFAKLKTELSLQPLYLKIGGNTETLHVGRYPDSSDRMHWLVVRESPLHIWEWESISQIAPGNKSFYEVVVDADLINKIRDKLNPKQGSQTAEDSPTDKDLN